MKIQVQGLFPVQCLLKYVHIYSISFFFRFSGLKKSSDLCTTFILNPVLYQKFCLCISYLVSGSTTRLLLPLLVILNSFEKSTSCLPSRCCSLKLYNLYMFKLCRHSILTLSFFSKVIIAMKLKFSGFTKLLMGYLMIYHSLF